LFLAGTGRGEPRLLGAATWGTHMNGVIYLVGLIVVVMAILSFVGLR
jgi:hypothetical protein